ncbi:DUF4236 domain-containing protein [Streptacidiphilus carbonis]|uniref:DUF4236 domain-containing protein n=1 Tax=Streptacidiphilus carbonis TaxID=105422 RepID=UPI0007C690B2|nr:DUF4236 domain-containing protein [Streptacidiphilus carbonis]
MGFSYRKSFKAGPIRVTASKSGISYSAGVKGARVTKRANGRVTTRVSAPGTGLSYTTGSGRKSAGKTTRSTQPAPAVRPVPTNGQRSTVLPEQPPAGMKPLPFKGYLATVTLHPNRIEISRTVMGKLTGNRSSSIPWPQIVAVDFLEPTRARNGHIHFVTATDPRGLTSTGNGDRTAATARNTHAIMFTWQQRARYEQLRNLLSANVRPAMAATSATPTAPTTAPGYSVADELDKLGRLFQQGILSGAEFEAAKAKLLG